MAPSAETRALADELRSRGAAPRARRRRGAAPARALARAERGPLVGRARAARRPAGRLAAGERGRRRPSWSLAGEAGSGKTRLLAELAGEARDAGATVLAGRCVEDGVVRVRALHRGAAPVRGRRPGRPPRVGPGRARAPAAGAGRRGPARRSGDAADARHRLFEAVAAAVGHAARAGRCCWSSRTSTGRTPPTLQLLAHVVRSVGWAPLLVVGSLRDEGAEAAPALRALLGDLRRERRLERIDLGGLSEDEAGELAAAWLGGPPPPALAAAVHRRTGGNPLFVEELVRHLVESHPGEPAEALVAAAEREVPHGVRAVIDRRLARLGEAVGAGGEGRGGRGRGLRARRRRRRVRRSATRPSPSGLDARGRRRAGRRVGGAGRYRFAHALVREAVIAGMSATRRALLHRRIGEVLRGAAGRRP